MFLIYNPATFCWELWAPGMGRKPIYSMPNGEFHEIVDVDMHKDEESDNKWKEFEE